MSLLDEINGLLEHTDNMDTEVIILHPGGYSAFGPGGEQLAKCIASAKLFLRDFDSEGVDDER
jgi:hypothetical protein